MKLNEAYYKTFAVMTSPDFKLYRYTHLKAVSNSILYKTHWQLLVCVLWTFIKQRTTDGD